MEYVKDQGYFAKRVGKVLRKTGMYMYMVKKEQPVAMSI